MAQKAKQTIKMKVHKGTTIPGLTTTVKSNGGKAYAKTTIKAKIHRKKK